MKRKMVFHVLQTYVPTSMLVCISWLSFWLDVRAGPARISLTITTLLTLVSVSNGARQDLPQVSYIKAIDIWLTTCTAFVFGVLLEFTVVSFYMGMRQTTSTCKHRRHGANGMPWQPNGTLLEKPQARGPCSSCVQNIERRARNVDVASRLIFPSTFGVFFAVYWSYYLMTYHKEDAAHQTPVPPPLFPPLGKRPMQP